MAEQVAFNHEVGGSKPSTPTTLARLITSVLTPDLNNPGYSAACYPAAEALFHLVGGKESGFKPMRMRVGNIQHWWVRGSNGIDYDPTAYQFNCTPAYENGTGCGFLTKEPSKRARIIMERVKSKL